MDQYANVNLKAYTTVPEYSWYLSNKKPTSAGTQISEPTTGLMMMLSLLQYQSAAVGPVYSGALNQASQAAFVQSGGKTMEDGLKQRGLVIVHDAGITNTESAIVLGGIKTFQSKQLSWDNLHIDAFKLHMSLNQTGGSVGVKYEFK